MPDWYDAAISWAWHGDDGKIFFSGNSVSQAQYADPYGKGDTVGCGVIYQNSVDGTIFYSRNDEALGMLIPRAFDC